MYSVSSKTSMAMPISFSNICSLNKLSIRSLFLFKSSSRKFSIISFPYTRNAGLVLEHSFSGIPTDKLGHHFARNHGYATKGNNPFPDYTEEYYDRISKKRKRDNSEHESHAPDPQLRNEDDDTDSYSNNSTLSHVDSLLSPRPHREVGGAFDFVKATLRPILLQKLKNVHLEDVTVKSGLEIAASIDLLRLFGESSCKLDEVGRTALQGARLLEEGQNKVNDGKGMLKCAFDKIPNHFGRKINSS